MKKLDLIQLSNYEKQLLSYRSYTFENYSRLEIINAHLRQFLADTPHFTDKQLLLDLTFEIENEQEQLLQLRFTQDKNTEFNERVQTTLAIINRLKPYILQYNSTNANTGLWSRVKRAFKM